MVVGCAGRERSFFRGRRVAIHCAKAVVVFGLFFIRICNSQLHFESAWWVIVIAGGLLVLLLVFGNFVFQVVHAGLFMFWFIV